MKKKIIVSLFMSACLLTLGGMTSLQAQDSLTGDTTIGYSTNSEDMVLEIKGPQSVIKGTAGHSYQGYLDNKETSIIWSIKGATSKDTRIDEGGFLIVGVDETATEIEIIGNLSAYPTRFATMKVSLIDKTYTIIDVEKKADITLPYGTNEQTLKDELQKNETFKVTIKTNDDKTFVLEVSYKNYQLVEDMVNQDGLLKIGDYNVRYNLALPNISIDHNGVINYRTSSTSNITGKTSSDIMVHIVKKDTGGNNGGNGSVSKPTGPNTGDSTNLKLYAGLGSLMMISLLLLLLKRKKDNEQEEAQEESK